MSSLRHIFPPNACDNGLNNKQTRFSKTVENRHHQPLPGTQSGQTKQAGGGGSKIIMEMATGGKRLHLRRLEGDLRLDLELRVLLLNAAVKLAGTPLAGRRAGQYLELSIKHVQQLLVLVPGAPFRTGLHHRCEVRGMERVVRISPGRGGWTTDGADGESDGCGPQDSSADGCGFWTGCHRAWRAVGAMGHHRDDQSEQTMEGWSGVHCVGRRRAAALGDGPFAARGEG